MPNCHTYMYHHALLPPHTDPQADSLKALVDAVAAKFSATAWDYLTTGYCRPQTVLQPVISPGPEVLNPFARGYQVNCTGQYITKVSFSPTNRFNTTIWPGGGFLPNATNLGGLSQLQSLNCDGCGLKGTLPRDWGTQDALMELRELDLRGNSLTGTLPETWGNMVNLVSLTLSSLNTTSLGRIPSAWGYMRSLALVNLTGALLDNSATSCAPWQWRTVNRLILNVTFFPPSNYPNMPFCDVT